MARKRYTAEEIIGHLRTIEIEMGKGLAVVDACRKLGITEQSSGMSCSMGNCSIRSAKHRCSWSAGGKATIRNDRIVRWAIGHPPRRRSTSGPRSDRHS